MNTNAKNPFSKFGLKPATMRPAFTLIEILVSIVILATSIVYVMKIYEQKHAQTAYIIQRNSAALSDSLFLTEDALRYSKKEKNAYDMLHDTFRNIPDKTGMLLKQTKRKIYVSAPVKLMESDDGPNAEVRKLILKDTFTASYHRFKVTGF